nr:PREDICTED: mitochondrial ribonuclease P protein 1 homolog [Bemisia tabaci]
MLNFRSWRFILLGTPVVSRSFSRSYRFSNYFSPSDIVRKIHSPVCKRTYLNNVPNFPSYQGCRLFSKGSQADELSDNTVSTEESAESFYQDVDYEAITNNDPALLKQLKIIMAEIYVLYEEGEQVPSKLSTNHYIELLKHKSHSRRRNYLKYLLMKERFKESEARKKLSKRAALEEFKAQRKENPEEDSGEKLVYNLSNTSLFLRIYDSTIDRFNNLGLHLASMYAPTIIMDCSYDADMSHRETQAAVNQITQGFGEHRKHLCPSNFVFCNYKKEGKMATKLLQSVPCLYDPEYPFEFTSKSYLDLYPRDKLVYLTPHCRNELTTINIDDIYIIGAMVDMVSHSKASLSRAKQQGLRMAKFPIDQHLLWGSGTKNLTINQVMMIMADMYWKNDWKFAFDRWIPKRKLMQNDQAAFAAKYSRMSEGSGQSSSEMHNAAFMKRRNSTRHYRKDFYDLRNDLFGRKWTGAEDRSAMEPKARLEPRSRR